jgi:hypothetical protein
MNEPWLLTPAQVCFLAGAMIAFVGVFVAVWYAGAAIVRSQGMRLLGWAAVALALIGLSLLLVRLGLG